MNFYHSLINLPKFNKPAITIGSFDGVHQGHQIILNQIAEQAKQSSSDAVIITFEPHPRQVIYPKDQSLRLITDLEEKKFLMNFYGVQNLVVVPFSIEFSQISADEYIAKFLVETFQPKNIIIGYDHKFGLNRQGDINYLRWYESKYNYRVIEISQHLVNESAVSSSKIRTAIESGMLAKAQELLGHPYIMGGTVIYGNQLGQKLGFPTANLQPNNGIKLIPQDGIYAVLVHVNNEIHKGVLYIGNKPTIGSFQKSIEVHIFDFNQDLYGQNIMLEFKEYIREDAKFDNLESMAAQITIDANKSRDILLKDGGQSYFKK